IGGDRNRREDRRRAPGVVVGTRSAFVCPDCRRHDYGPIISEIRSTIRRQRERTSLMEVTTSRLVRASQSAVEATGALAAQYAFSILGAMILLVAGYIAAGLAERWLLAGLKRVRGFDETLRIFFSK